MHCVKESLRAVSRGNRKRAIVSLRKASEERTGKAQVLQGLVKGETAWEDGKREGGGWRRWQCKRKARETGASEGRAGQLGVRI